MSGAGLRSGLHRGVTIKLHPDTTLFGGDCRDHSLEANQTRVRLIGRLLVRLVFRLKLRLELRPWLEGGRGGSGITTLDKKS